MSKLEFENIRYHIQKLKPINIRKDYTKATLSVSSKDEKQRDGGSPFAWGKCAKMVVQEDGKTE